MNPPPTRTTSLVLSVLFLIGTLAFLLLPSWVSEAERYSTGLSFNTHLDTAGPVVMRITASAHYQFDTEEGAEEYGKLLPRGGYMVHVRDQDTGSVQPYTVTLFHQMKCLDILRREYLALEPGSTPTPITHHCLNYLRQSILCRPNIRLESVKNIVGTAIRDYESVCMDWTKVYEEAERNYEVYLDWNATKGTL